MNPLEALVDELSQSDALLSFSNRPDPIPGDLRISWRLAMICLIVERSRGRKAGLQGAHVLWWAVRSPANRRQFSRWFKEERAPDEMMVRFDPSLSDSLDLAIGSGLVEIDSNTNIILTDQGLALAQHVLGDVEVMVQEKEFLDTLPRRITKASMERLLEWR